MAIEHAYFSFIYLVCLYAADAGRQLFMQLSHYFSRTRNYVHMLLAKMPRKRRRIITITPAIRWPAEPLSSMMMLASAQPRQKSACTIAGSTLTSRRACYYHHDDADIREIATPPNFRSSVMLHVIT